METFGSRLRNARKNNNLTQKELAEMIGAKHNSISNWENDQNKPDPDTIKLICGVLDIEPNYLIRPDIEVHKISKDADLKRLINYMNALTELNKRKVLSYSEGLVDIQNQEEKLNAAHSIEGATVEEKQHDEDIMDDADF